MQKYLGSRKYLDWRMAASGAKPGAKSGAKRPEQAEIGSNGRQATG